MKTRMRTVSISILASMMLVTSCTKDNNETIPALVSLEISSISATSATVSCEVTSDGNTSLLSRGICWDTLPNPTVESGMKTSDTLVTGLVTSQMSGLAPNKTYYVRGYAANAVGIAYSEEESFTTLIALPTVSSIALIVSSVGRYGSTCVIESTGNGTILRKGFCMSIVNKYPTIDDRVEESIYTSEEMYLMDISEFFSGYYIRAFATNEAGTGYSNVIKHCHCIDMQNLICEEEDCTAPTFR